MKFKEPDRTREEEMAGSATLDKWRPYRLGENLARAEWSHDDDRRAYYESLLDHMTSADRGLAQKGYMEMREAVAPREVG